MARRGEELREHILFTAKDVFLETGFERASMDTLAARAATSKRTLYAHFESKDKLFLAVVDLVRELYLDRLRTPGEYAGDDAEAVVLYCGRFLQMLLWEPTLRMCRLGIAEAERLPEASARYYDAIFHSAHQRLADHLGRRLGLPPADCARIAHELIGRTLHPRFLRALFGTEELLTQRPEKETIAADVDLAPIRAAVAALLPSAR
ncbi:TetR/AcrR family transcriptional regulator [Streptomyces cocklensis]|uniref:Transcriptional regulator, TetR family n=1 Tax=Actinacidiphila cocklensis TaxID=887465 RepID=A0A9W4GQK6_9ACTN|nr:TetR/AcrR family transcriptional regulator [Actinacidiphila cocklensis]MDD1063254.1 TetR/AcrR family transcriptional regulator [Actinacidiphila cocklensis]CAG6393694.1 Transcriptional regulator, TetR family [Actinacidiphila cocklensis]